MYTRSFMDRHLPPGPCNLADLEIHFTYTLSTLMDGTQSQDRGKSSHGYGNINDDNESASLRMPKSHLASAMYDSAGNFLQFAKY